MTTGAEISIPKPDFFNFKEILWFLDRGYDDCLYRLTDDSIIKWIILSSNDYLIEIKDEGKDLVIDVLESQKGEILINEIRSYVTDWFDLDRDLLPFYTLLEDHNYFHPLTQFKGLRLISMPSLFEALCWSIIGQQINLKFAYKLKRRFVEKYGHTQSFEGHDYHNFPKPYIIAELNREDLLEIQFSRQKADYVIGVARFLCENMNYSIGLQALDSSSEIIESLKKLKGIGDWTANYAVMKAFRRMDCIPHGDVGLLQALQKQLNLPSRPDRQEVIDQFESFKGWESYLTFYLWRSLSENDI